MAMVRSGLPSGELVDFERETAVTLSEGDSAHAALGISEERFHRLEDRMIVGPTGGVTSVGFDPSVLAVKKQPASPTRPEPPKPPARIAPDLLLSASVESAAAARSSSGLAPSLSAGRTYAPPSASFTRPPTPAQNSGRTGRSGFGSLRSKEDPHRQEDLTVKLNHGRVIPTAAIGNIDSVISKVNQASNKRKRSPGNAEEDEQDNSQTKTVEDSSGPSANSREATEEVDPTVASGELKGAIREDLKNDQVEVEVNGLVPNTGEDSAEKGTERSAAPLATAISGTVGGGGGVGSNSAAAAGFFSSNSRSRGQSGATPGGNTTPTKNNNSNNSNYESEPQSKKRRLFSAQEDKVLMKAVDKHGKNWKTVVAQSKLARTSDQVRRRFKVLERRDSGLSGLIPPGSAPPQYPQNQEDSGADTFAGRVAGEILSRGNSRGSLGYGVDAESNGSNTVNNSADADSICDGSPSRGQVGSPAPSPYARSPSQPMIRRFFAPIGSNNNTEINNNTSNNNNSNNNNSNNNNSSISGVSTNRTSTMSPARPRRRVSQTLPTGASGGNTSRDSASCFEGDSNAFINTQATPERRERQAKISLSNSVLALEGTTSQDVPSTSKQQGGSTSEGTLQQQQQQQQQQEEMAALQFERSRLQTQVRTLQERLANEVQEREIAISTLEDKRHECESTYAQLQNVDQEKQQRRLHVAKFLQTMMREADKQEALIYRQKNVEAGFLLGRIVVHKHSVGKVQEVWEDGQLMRDLRYRQGLILEQREALEVRKKDLSKLSRKRNRAEKSAAAASGSNSNGSTTAAAAVESNNNNNNNIDDDGGIDDVDMLDLIEAEETLRVQMLNIKKEEVAMMEEKNRLAAQKATHVRSLKRIRDEDMSRFNKHPTLNQRYLLRSMLGKGGFSEVWKAFDLHELRDVAVKIHELNPRWSEAKKTSYSRHATREYRIHMALVHPRIVQLYDVFEIDINSFATVLEYCEGHDLDLHLKQHKLLAEREARALLIQILSGLRYLSSGGAQMAPPSASIENVLAHSDAMEEGGLVLHGGNHDHSGQHEVQLGGGVRVHSAQEAAQAGGASRRRIIHFDLKPANIVLDNDGMVKITDFGLSKVLEAGNAEASEIELTSQGAGTYWYLPPECFRVGNSPPKISSKVDVWSCGVIFFQMLYGRRPFGEGQTQEGILTDNTMLRATKVEFPLEPRVSREAKEFIQQCLTYDQHRRPDVDTLCKHPYLRLKRI